MVPEKKICDYIILKLNNICKNNPQKFTETTQLIGENRSIKSAELVELLLSLEEYVEDNLNSKFDWTGDTAMSERRSILRTVKTLTEHIYNLQDKQ